MKVFTCFFHIIFFIHLSLAREEWVDPHDMNMRIKPKKSNIYVDNEKEQIETFSLDARYLKNFVQLVINRLNFNHNEDMYEGHIAFKLNQEEYDFLKDFVRSEHNSYTTLEKLKSIMKKLFEEDFHEKVLISVMEYIYFVFTSENTVIAIVLLGTVFILWKMQPHKYELKTLFKIFLPLIYMADFVLRYIALLEKEEVDKYLEQKSYSTCDINNLSLPNRVYNWFTGYCEKTERRFLLSKRAAYHLITPMKVFGEQFDIIVPFLKYTGEGFGNLTFSLMQDAPWYMKPLLSVSALMIMTIILLMFGCHFLNISPKLSLLHIFHLEFLQKDHVVKENCQRKERLTNNKNYKLFIIEKPKEEKKTVRKRIIETNEEYIDEIRSIEDADTESDSKDEIEEIDHVIQHNKEEIDKVVGRNDNEKNLN